MDSSQTSNLVEVVLNDSEDFLKIRETLTRIGVASKKDKKLYQSCHILHKRGKYYVVHFKELFILDGKPSDFSDNDRSRRNAIINLLEEWDLITVPSKDELEPVPCLKLRLSRIKKRWNGTWFQSTISERKKFLDILIFFC